MCQILCFSLLVNVTDALQTRLGSEGWLTDRNRRQPFTTSECEKRKASKLGLRVRDLPLCLTSKRVLSWKDLLPHHSLLHFTFSLTSIRKVRIRKCHLPKTNQKPYLSFWYNSEIISMDRESPVAMGMIMFSEKSSIATSPMWSQWNKTKLLSLSSACELEHS